MPQIAQSETDAPSNFSNKPIYLTVPFAAGGPTDVMARAFALSLSEKLTRQVVVENKPGAGGNIAANYVLGLPADGNHLLVAGQAIMAINKPLYSKLTYDAEKDFSWIGMMGSLPNVLLVNFNALPVKSVSEFIAFAKNHPSEIAYGSNGIGSLTHLCTEVLATTAGISLLHVPYQGVAPQISDLLSGRISVSLVAASSALPLIKSGQLKALAVSSKNRMSSLPDVPSLIESGFPMLDVPVWFSVVAASSTSPRLLQQLRHAMQLVMSDSKYESEILKQEGQLNNLNPDQAQEMLLRERKIWSDAVLKTHASAS
jgi:tripartite-type tricarboxylate transporter receptor subunit TctC